MEVVRHQYLFVNSAKCIGSPSDFLVQVDDGLVETHNTEERIKLTLIDFSILHNWGNINASNNTITFRNVVTGINTVVTIPFGFYTMNDIKKYINNAYPAAIVAYNNNTNRYTFTFTQTHQLIFTSEIYKVLGFGSAESPQGTIVTSSTTCQPRNVNSLNMHMYNVQSLKHHNIENVASDSVKKSHMIARIPVTAEPYENVIWINRAEHYGFIIREDKLHRLRFRFVDDDGKQLDYLTLPPCTFTIKIDYVKPKVKDLTLYRSIDDIKEYLRLLFLSSQLKA